MATNAESLRRGLRSTDKDPVTGRPMYQICDLCNYDRHVCMGCGGNEGIHNPDCSECLAERD